MAKPEEPVDEDAPRARAESAKEGPKEEGWKPAWGLLEGEEGGAWGDDWLRWSRSLTEPQHSTDLERSVMECRLSRESQAHLSRLDLSMLNPLSTPLGSPPAHLDGPASGELPKKLPCLGRLVPIPEPPPPLTIPVGVLIGTSCTLPPSLETGIGCE
jgi:hypothetical protein